MHAVHAARPLPGPALPSFVIQDCSGNYVGGLRGSTWAIGNVNAYGTEASIHAYSLSLSTDSFPNSLETKERDNNPSIIGAGHVAEIEIPQHAFQSWVRVLLHGEVRLSPCACVRVYPCMHILLAGKVGLMRIYCVFVRGILLV